DDLYINSFINNYFPRPVGFSDENFASGSMASADQSYLVEITKSQNFMSNVNDLHSRKSMGQFQFEDGILESQSSRLSDLPQTDNCENEVIESQNFVSNFSDQRYFEDEVLESQNSQFNSEDINTTLNNRSSLNMYLVDAVNNDNSCQSDADSVHMQDIELENEYSLELTQGLTFPNWQLFKIWIEQFAKREGFSYKIRTSETDDNGIIRRATYVCTKAGIYFLL
ncbi:19213_t:CDS:2, partial [Gigaspora rosea]